MNRDHLVPQCGAWGSPMGGHNVREICKQTEPLLKACEFTLSGGTGRKNTMNVHCRTWHTRQDLGKTLICLRLALVWQRRDCSQADLQCRSAGKQATAVLLEQRLGQQL